MFSRSISVVKRNGGALSHTLLRHLFIKTSATPNPECLKFYSQGLTFLEGNRVLDFTSPKAGVKSPLAQRLFDVGGVKAVFVASDYVTVTKEDDKNWNDLDKKIFAAIENWKASGEKIYDDTVHHSDTAPQPDDDEVVLDIKEMLEGKIRPMVQRDGGNIRYLGFEDGVIFLQMQGACSSCPSSASTLKNGIERMLMHWIPEVSGVKEVTQNDSDKLLEHKTKTGSFKGYVFTVPPDACKDTPKH